MVKHFIIIFNYWLINDDNKVFIYNNKIDRKENGSLEMSG